MVGIICRGRFSISVDQIWVNLMNLIEEFTEKKLGPVWWSRVSQITKKNAHKLICSSEGTKKRSGADIRFWTWEGSCVEWRWTQMVACFILHQVYWVAKMVLRNSMFPTQGAFAVKLRGRYYCNYQGLHHGPPNKSIGLWSFKNTWVVHLSKKGCCRIIWMNLVL